MTLTTPQQEAQPRRAARPGTPATLPPTKSRRRPGLVVIGSVLVILCGLASYYFIAQASGTVTVLETKVSVDRGDKITAGDLTTIRIAGGQESIAFTASQAEDVIGKIATVDLPSGSLVTSKNVGGQLSIGSGQSVVGVALTTEQLPNFPLAAGDRVRLVDTPISQGDPPATTPETFRATVFTSTYDSDQRKWIVDLVVPESQAADVAARSATGRIALILDSEK